MDDCAVAGDLVERRGRLGYARTFAAALAKAGDEIRVVLSDLGKLPVEMERPIGMPRDERVWPCQTRACKPP
ncbi:MAG: hypothetical protein MRJ92_06625 [Nitrospira sp.]|nr:hypothetical protein [Nitrospira sp.]